VKKKKKTKQITENVLKEKGIAPTTTPQIKVKASDNNAKDLVANGKHKKVKQNHELKNIRNVKKRLEIESDYIEELLSLVKFRPSVIHEEEDSVFLGKNFSHKNVFVSEENRAKSHQELRDRFQKKMDEFQEKKKNKDGKTKPVKEVVTKQMKRAAKKKLKREEIKKGLMKASASKGNLTKGNLGSQFEGVKTKGSGGDEDQPKENIVFSKFDFVEPLKSVRGPAKNNDPKAALQKIKSQKEKLKIMKEKGLTEKVELIESKEKWKKALEKSEGVKVKDDEELLKKTIRRKEHDKKKGTKLWKEQKEGVESKKAAKQKKRETNLTKRKTDKKDKKKKLAIKKGRWIPGL